MKAVPGCKELLRKNQKMKTELAKVYSAILVLYNSGKRGFTSQEITSVCDVNPLKIEVLLYKLQRQGVLRQRELSGGTYWFLVRP